MKGRLRLQGRRAETEAGEPLRSDQEAVIGDVEIDAARGLAIEQSYRRRWRRRRGPENCESGSRWSGRWRECPRRAGCAGRQRRSPGRRRSPWFRCCGRRNALGVGLDELAMDVGGDGANQVGDEDETVFQDADAIDDAALEILRDLTAERRRCAGAIELRK